MVTKVTEEDYYKCLEEMSKKYNVVIYVLYEAPSPGVELCFDKERNEFKPYCIIFPTFKVFMEAYSSIAEKVPLCVEIEHHIKHELHHVDEFNYFWKNCKEKLLHYFLLGTIVGEIDTFLKLIFHFINNSMLNMKLIEELKNLLKRCYLPYTTVS